MCPLPNEEDKTTGKDANTSEKEPIESEKPKLKESKSAEKIDKQRAKSEDSSSESEGCDGPILDEDLAEATSSAGLKVSGVDHNSFLSLY